MAGTEINKQHSLFPTNLQMCKPQTMAMIIPTVRISSLENTEVRTLVISVSDMAGLRIIFHLLACQGGSIRHGSSGSRYHFNKRKRKNYILVIFKPQKSGIHVDRTDLGCTSSG